MSCQSMLLSRGEDFSGRAQGDIFPPHYNNVHFLSGTLIFRRLSDGVWERVMRSVALGGFGQGCDVKPSCFNC